MRIVRLPESYSARPMLTESAGVVAEGLTVSVAVRLVVYSAWIFTGVLAVTAVVVTVKVPVVAPAGIVMLSLGTPATARLSLVSETQAPPAGAGAPRVTVPVVEPPPVSDEALSAIDVTPVVPGSVVPSLTLAVIWCETVEPRASVSVSVKTYVPAAVRVPPSRASGPAGLSWMTDQPGGRVPVVVHR